MQAGQTDTAQQATWSRPVSVALPLPVMAADSCVQIMTGCATAGMSGRKD
jgi:hypothetical protein